MVFNATFNNISVISWRSVLLVEETGVPRENHQPVASDWQILSHNVVHLALIEIRTHDLSGDRYLIAEVVLTIIQSRPRRPHNLLIMTYVQLVKHFPLFKVYALIFYSCGRIVRDRAHNVTVLQLLIVRCYFFSWNI